MQVQAKQATSTQTTQAAAPAAKPFIKGIPQLSLSMKASEIAAELKKAGFSVSVSDEFVVGTKKDARVSAQFFQSGTGTVSDNATPLRYDASKGDPNEVGFRKINVMDGNEDRTLNIPVPEKIADQLENGVLVNGHHVKLGSDIGAAAYKLGADVIDGEFLGGSKGKFFSTTQKLSDGTTRRTEVSALYDGRVAAVRITDSKIETGTFCGNRDQVTGMLDYHIAAGGEDMGKAVLDFGDKKFVAGNDFGTAFKRVKL